MIARQHACTIKSDILAKSLVNICFYDTGSYIEKQKVFIQSVGYETKLYVNIEIMKRTYISLYIVRDFDYRLVSQ